MSGDVCEDINGDVDGDVSRDVSGDSGGCIGGGVSRWTTFRYDIYIIGTTYLSHTRHPSHRLTEYDVHCTSYIGVFEKRTMSYIIVVQLPAIVVGLIRTTYYYQIRHTSPGTAYNVGHTSTTEHFYYAWGASTRLRVLLPGTGCFSQARPVNPIITLCWTDYSSYISWIHKNTHVYKYFQWFPI